MGCIFSQKNASLTLPKEPSIEFFTVTSVLTTLHVFQCPFQTVRTHVLNFLTKKRSLNYVVRTSFYVSQKSLVPITPENEHLRQMFEDIFASRGRLSHLDQILAWHPSYLEAFTYTTEFLMHEEGELPLHVRNYLAIMGSSVHGCEYLVSLQESEFIFNRGSPVWLKGLQNVPAKIRRLQKLAHLLANSPWKITPSDIAEHLGSIDSWSVPELVQILAILTTYIAFSGLVFGMGLLPEMDMEEASRPTRKSRAEYKLDNHMRKQVVLNSQKLEQMLEREVSTGNKKEKGKGCAEIEDIFCEASAVDSKYSHYVGQGQGYRDFSIKGEKLHRKQDFGWRSHAYGLMTRFYPHYSPLLNQEFDVIYNLTYKKLTRVANVDTGPFRRAVWYYVDRLYGIEHDDYDYAHINKFLNRQVKQYIKKCACYPQTITRSDYEVFGYDFTDDEKCHVAILALNARRQASLIYALKALSKYMSLSQE
eukprot:1058607-Amorphochlora_amoeboformis.AAC.3